MKNSEMFVKCSRLHMGLLGGGTFTIVSGCVHEAWQKSAHYAIGHPFCDQSATHNWYQNSQNGVAIRHKWLYGLFTDAFRVRLNDAKW